jgi:hypothetical protein
VELFHITYYIPMKHIVAFLFAVILSAFVQKTHAQPIVPTISYQGAITDAGGNLLEGNHSLKIGLYDSPTGGTPLFSDLQSVDVHLGHFDIVIGSSALIPSTLAFDKQYYLGLQIDGQSEMTPRSRLSFAPYAFRALSADVAAGLGPNATGAVTSINNQSGALTFVGGGGTTINQSGGTITISSTAGSGGTGVQGLQNIDGSLFILSPNGPTADLSIATNGITTSKILDGAVTLPKISTTSAAAGQVLTYNGSALTWSTPLTGLILPYAQTVASASTAFSITNTSPRGFGIAGNTDSGYAIVGTSTSGCGVFGISTNFLSGYFQNVNAGNTLPTLKAQTIGIGPGISSSAFGTGRAGEFIVNNVANSSGALVATTNGTGRAGDFSITNGTSSANAINASTTGSGTAVFGTSTSGKAANFVISTITSAATVVDASTTGTGKAGIFTIANTSNAVEAITATTSGTGKAAAFSNTSAANSSAVASIAHSGIGSGLSVALTNASNGARGIDVSQAGVGPGVFATSTGGNAVWGITSSISAAGVIGDNTYGEAIVGRNRGGNGVGAVVGRNDSSGYGVRGFNTKAGIGVLGQAGISGGTGVGGRFENVNAANTNNALEAITNGSGRAGVFVSGGTAPTLTFATTHIENFGTSGEGMWLRNASSTSTLAALKVHVHPSSTSSIFEGLTWIGSGTATKVVRIDKTGKGFFNGGTQNSGADVAEALEVTGLRSSYGPGDVLVLSTDESHHVALSSEAYSDLVAGVYATKPGVLLTEENVDADLSQHVPMGVIGVIPTKVSGENGAIHIGDLLVTSSTPGHAMKGDRSKIHIGNVLGKAMENFSASGTGKIKVLVGRY